MLMVIGIVSIIAIILGPILGIRIEKYLSDKSNKKNKQLFIFQTLMLTRGNRLSPQCVNALNMIEVEFYGISAVTEAWKNLLDHYINGFPKNTNSDSCQVLLNQAVEKVQELYSKLLLEMGKVLGYSFDEVYLKRSFYAPQGHVDEDVITLNIRNCLSDILSGKKFFPVKIEKD